MVRQCERCKGDITIKYLVSQEDYEVITCPNCGRNLYVTDISKFFSIIVFVMTFFMFILMPLGELVLLLTEVIWIIVSKNYLPAFLYYYEEMKEEEE